MRALQGWPMLRPLFPGLRLTALGALLCAAALGLLALAGRGDAPQFFLQGAALVAGGWWLLLGSQLCLLVYGMVPLRLPCTARLLRRGVLLHLALSTGLPLLALCGRLPAGVDVAALAAALWLGSAAGLLIVSLPMAGLIVPLGMLAADGAVLSQPLWCGLLGAAALGLSGLAWRWQLGCARSALWAPAGVALAGSYGQLVHLVQTLPGAQQRRDGRSHRASPAVRLARLDLLAAVLGPACQTMRQAYGRRGRHGVYLVFAGVTLALWGGAAIQPPATAGDGAGGGIFLATVMVAALLLVAMGPASRLTALRRPGLAELAELRLTPGLPGSAQLPAALMRQMLHCLVERLALAACVLPAAAGLSYAIHPLWLCWWMGLAGLALLLGLATAWLAWLGRSRSLWWLGMAVLAGVLAIGSNVRLLVHARPLEAGWLMAWAAWGALAVLVLWVLGRPGARGVTGQQRLQ